jgi:hypothetical protein
LSALLSFVVLVRSSALLRCSVLVRCSVLLACSALGTSKILGARECTFAQALEEVEILILLISTIYTVLDKNKGDDEMTLK